MRFNEVMQDIFSNEMFLQIYKLCVTLSIVAILLRHTNQETFIKNVERH